MPQSINGPLRGPVRVWPCSEWKKFGKMDFGL